jgi:hypothetical protein
VPDVRICGARRSIPEIPTGVPVIVGLLNVLFVRVCVAARPTSVSVTAGSVSVLVPATAAAVRVISPDVEPLSFIGILIHPAN